MAARWDCRRYRVSPFCGSNASIPVPSWISKFRPHTRLNGPWGTRGTKNETNAKYSASASWSGSTSRSSMPFLSKWYLSLNLTISHGQIACRLIVPSPLQAGAKSKISGFCHVHEDQVVGVHDLASIYHVPLLLESQGIVKFLQKRLSLPQGDQLPKAMIDNGMSLTNRWKELTQR